MAARAQSVMSGAPEEAKRLVVQPAVGRQHGARVDIRLALEVREAPARLLDDDLHGRRVPRLEIALGVDLALPGGHEAVAVVVAEAALPRGGVDQPHEAVPVADALEQVEARVQQHRVRHAGTVRDADALTVRPRALTRARPEELARHRVVDHARRHLPFFLEGDQDSPDRDMADEVLRAVDGIDDPPARSRAFGAELLAEEAHAWCGPGEDGPDGLLRLLVGLGHRSLVRLDRDLEAALVVPHGDLAGGT